MYEFPCPEPVTIAVRIGSGTLHIHAEERATAEVEVEPYDGSDASSNAAAKTVVEMRGDRLHIETPEGTGGFLIRRGGRVRVSVRVPLDCDLQVKTGSADTSCQGRMGSITVHSGSGDISIEDTSGDLIVNTGSGDISARSVGGAVRVNGASGDLHVQRALGEVTSNMASGDVRIGDAAGGVRITTASGDINLEATHAGDVRVNSASGDVIVGVTAGTSVWLDLSTVSGATNSDLHMPNPGAAPTAGTPALNLQVRTMSGDILVRRVYAPAA